MTSINFLDVVPGDRIVLLDGAEIVVTHNPDDGLWLFGQYLSHPDKPSMVDGCDTPFSLMMSKKYFLLVEIQNEAAAPHSH